MMAVGADVLIGPNAGWPNGGAMGTSPPTKGVTIKMPWYIYILRCADGTLYTGITDDVEKRFAAHAAGKGAKYTRGRGPLELVHTEAVPDNSAALQRDAAAKKPSRAGKLNLIGEI